MPLDFRDPAYLYDMVEAGKKIARYIHQKMVCLIPPVPSDIID